MLILISAPLSRFSSLGAWKRTILTEKVRGKEVVRSVILASQP
jgi:hypothetical protein